MIKDTFWKTLKEKTARIIRVITIPPLEVLIMLLLLYGNRRSEFGTRGNLLIVIFFLAIVPICAYPLAARGKEKADTRSRQRKMAFIFNILAYLAAMLIGYACGYSQMLQWILNDYFLAVLVLTIINKVFKIRASGHACSCTLPYLFLSYYFGVIAAIICLLLYLAEFWASVELKRHTVKEFLLGTAVACLVFAVSLL